MGQKQWGLMVFSDGSMRKRSTCQCFQGVHALRSVKYDLLRYSFRNLHLPQRRGKTHLLKTGWILSLETKNIHKLCSQLPFMFGLNNNCLWFIEIQDFDHYLKFPQLCIVASSQCSPHTQTPTHTTEGHDIINIITKSLNVLHNWNIAIILQAILYSIKTWSSSLREKHKMQMK